ncbi:MAG TPA: EAL domain-containing protein [Novosphingobium sp.]|nr:EAL domain-containing protein [Novosphingobium sp.]HQA17630.1 EAL domain-containing protein [Novosphingobium sp.]
MVSKQAALRAAVPEELRDWVDNRLVSAHTRIVRVMVLGALLNTIVICLALWDGPITTPALSLFAGMVLTASLHRLWLAEGIERGRRRRRPRKLMIAFLLNSLWLGLSIAVPLALWLPRVMPGEQLLLAISGVAQIASAAYTVRTLVRSATVVILVQTIGLMIGLASLYGVGATGAILVLAVASGLLIRMAFTARDLFVTRILSDRDLAATTRTVRLLLNEYEENGSDWLFELDAKGALISVSQRFADAAGDSKAALEGSPFMALFTPDAARSALAEAISDGRPLRDMVVSLDGVGEGTQRWWSISGRASRAGGIVAYRGVISDVTSRRQAEDRVQRMAHFDTLTGLPNRALFDNAIENLLATRDEDDHVALILFDVDHFKAINDMHGHPTGDALLCALGERLSAAIGSSGLGGTQPLIARLGGDEFAVVVCGSDACDHAIRLSELLLIEMAKPVQIDELELHSGISIGMALAPFHAETKHHLQSYADIALNAVKANGRGDWEMFEPGMDAQLHQRHSLARDLRQAVGRGELRLFLQPLVDVASETMTGYEALLRWQHPERGLVPPDQFIPIAEETGLIVPIGEWVIRTALAEAAQWHGNETIAINLSPVQVESPGLLPMVVNALAESGIDPARVEFEITEGVLLGNSEANLEVLQRLQALGVKIALDDFGTGYASLNYLLTFPFDKIKIDRQFVSDLVTREESRAIVGAVIALANQLGMCTLAEGVEEREQLDQLRSDGCRMVQGWLFGKALPSEDYHPRTDRRHRGGRAASPVAPQRRTASQTYSRAKRA